MQIFELYWHKAKLDKIEQQIQNTNKKKNNNKKQISHNS